MRNLQEISFLYPGHSLLLEIEERDIEIKKRDRQLAGTTERANDFKAKYLAIRQALSEARQK